MLTQVGFRHAERVDPFDGGPHFVAKTSDVSAITRSQCLPYVGETGSATQLGLVAAFSATAPFVRAMRATCAVNAEGIALHSDTAARLQVKPGAVLTFLAQD
jgi:arginine N-succinyltransferase